MRTENLKAYEYESKATIFFTFMMIISFLETISTFKENTCFGENLTFLLTSKIMTSKIFMTNLCFLHGKEYVSQFACKDNRFCRNYRGRPKST